MPSQVDIYNQALGHLGVGRLLTSISERGKEANACNTYYETARDKVLADFPWPFALRTAELELVTDFTVRTDRAYEWAYSYRYPADALTLARMESGTGVRRLSSAMLPRHRVLSDATGPLIFADTPDAVIEYVARVTDTTKYPPNFTLALGALLAGLIAPQVTSGDPTRLGDRAFGLYQATITQAQLNAAREDVRDLEPESGFMEARGLGALSNDPRSPFL